MPAYMIFTREGPVTDQAEMEAYSSSNRANAGLFVEQHKLRPLAVYGAMETFEGEAPDGIVLLEFPRPMTRAAGTEARNISKQLRTG
jgi:uncharacterized protein (DUF1330 family)